MVVLVGTLMKGDEFVVYIFVPARTFGHGRNEYDNPFPQLGVPHPDDCDNLGNVLFRVDITNYFDPLLRP
jgi:hypothetical protein